MSQALFLLFYFMLFYNCIVPLGLFPREIQVAFPVESQLPRSRAAHATVHAWRSSVFVTHRTLAWTTGSLTCAHMVMHAIALGGCMDTVRESAVTVDSGRELRCCTGESNLCQRLAGLTHCQLNYILAHLHAPINTPV